MEVPRSSRAGGVNAGGRGVTLSTEKARVVDLQSLLVDPFIFLVANGWLLLNRAGFAVPLLLEGHQQDPAAVHLNKRG